MWRILQNDRVRFRLQAKCCLPMTNSGAVRLPEEQQRKGVSGENLDGHGPLLGAAGYGFVGWRLRRVHAADASRG